MLTYAKIYHDAVARERARKMLDWLLSIQMPNGAFQGGRVGVLAAVPVVFNTGQILIGLARGVEEFGETYRAPMSRAADWLVRVQDPDGAWRRYTSPLVVAGAKAYDTHVGWGLIAAERQSPGRGYAEAALANAEWALSRQRSNGWFDDCCLSDATRPLTHCVGYALRGVIEICRFYPHRSDLLEACRRTADALISALRDNGMLPGRLDCGWRPAVGWVCLTGSAQIAACWMLLHQETGDRRYWEAARLVNSFVRKTLCTGGPTHFRGAVMGAFPFNAEYGRYEYLNWACKFMIDANIRELALLREG